MYSRGPTMKTMDGHLNQRNWWRAAHGAGAQQIAGQSGILWPEVDRAVSGRYGLGRAIPSLAQLGSILLSFGSIDLSLPVMLQRRCCGPHGQRSGRLTSRQVAV